jgi:hypothetical protein
MHLPAVLRQMRIVPTLAALFLANAAWGQDSIPSPSQALNQWLSTEHLDKFLRIDTITSADGTVTINGTMAGKNNWANLQQDFLQKNHLTPEEYLFRNFQFRLNIAPANLQVSLEGVNAFVFISGNDTSVNSDLQLKMGAATDSLLIPVHAITVLANTKNITGWRSVSAVLDKLTQGFKQFFLQYKVASVDLYYEPLASPAQNKLTIYIGKIRKAALQSPVSWERYQVILIIQKHPDSMKVYTTIDGLFGRGIGDHEALDYRDLATYHPDALDLMKNRITTEIQRILTTPQP